MPLTRSHRYGIVIGLTAAFLVIELVIGLKTRSLAVIADAFHVLSDLLSFVVAFAARRLVARQPGPKWQRFTFGYQRAEILGGFFNGSVLIALGLSIFLQAIERFINVDRLENPKLVLIVGCVGLSLNLLSAIVVGHSHGNSADPEDLAPMSGLDGGSACGSHAELMAMQEPSTPSAGHAHSGHAHSHASGHFGMLGVMLHLLSDAINNIGVIIVALIIWLLPDSNTGKYYADPAITVFIAISIIFTGLPLTKRSGAVLLQASPEELDLSGIKDRVEKVEGVDSVHSLHVWQLTEGRSVATVHVIAHDHTLTGFLAVADRVKGLFFSLGIYDVTVQPELPDEKTDMCDVVKSKRLTTMA